MMSERQRKRIQRAVRAGATFVAYVLVQRKGSSRRLLFQCMAEPFDFWRCGVCGHGLLKAKWGERCACGATVRVVQKAIHPEEARRIEQKLFEDIESRRQLLGLPEALPFTLL